MSDATMQAVQSGSLILLSLASEDAATVAAAFLVAGGMLDVRLGWLTAFSGIWLGDLGVFAIARYFRSSRLTQKWISHFLQKADESSSTSKRLKVFLFLSRFVPGTRLPTFVLAGLSKMPLATFGLVTAFACIAWIALIFTFVQRLGTMAVVHALMVRSEFSLILFLLSIVIIVIAVERAIVRSTMKTSFAALRKYLHWEFWPAWLFYIPVVIHYLYLSVKYRSFTLPTIANPGMKLGGLIGDSKAEALQHLYAGFPSLVADGYLLEAAPFWARWVYFKHLLEENALDYPIVMKPDVGQRGSGFRIITSDSDAENYLRQFGGNILVQRYVPSTKEVGIFYYRFPHQGHGRVLAITEKKFPTLTGNGHSTIRQLIAQDPRASLIARIYLQRFNDKADTVLGEGEVLSLVAAGNHCQGAVFEDGARIWTRELEIRIDEISRALPGFFVGRYDIRFDSEEELRRGTSFKIVEVNGAASEATSIYDPRNSLWNAYRTLFKQWRLVFALGAANRQRGFKPAEFSILRNEWRRYCVESIMHPLAD
jgi:membrane protein DedA with SNARE-associated domain